MYNIKDQSENYCLCQLQDEIFLITKNNLINLEKDIKEKSIAKLKMKYHLINSLEYAKIRSHIRHGWRSNEEIFEAVLNGDYTKLLKDFDEFECDLNITKEAKKELKESMGDSKKLIKEKAKEKIEELIYKSNILEEDEKEIFESRLKYLLRRTTIKVIFNQRDKVYKSSRTSGNKDYIEIYHHKDLIELITGKPISEQFWVDPNFVVKNIGVMLHEIAHQVGKAFKGMPFGESFAVGFQSICLKEMGCDIELKKLIKSSSKNHKRENKEAEQENALYYCNRVQNIVQNKVEYQELQSCYKNIYKKYKEDERLVAIKLYASRKNASSVLREYGEVLLDKDKDLLEIFNNNLIFEREFKRELIVADVLALKSYYNNSIKENEDKLRIIYQYLFEANISFTLIIKLKENIEKTLCKNNIESIKCSNEIILEIGNKYIQGFQDKFLEWQKRKATVKIDFFKKHNGYNHQYAK